METTQFLEMWKDIREVFDATIEKYDKLWIQRDRKINTRFLVLFILRLTIPKDQRGYGATLLEIFDQFFNLDIHNSFNRLAPSSICEARAKLDPAIFKELNSGILKVWEKYNNNPRLWQGHRLYGVDGSKINLPRELLKADYQTPGDHAHYPQGLLSGAYDLLTGIPYDFDIVSHNNERTCALEHLKQIEENSITVYDRGYYSFELLADHASQRKHAIFRIKRNMQVKEIDSFWESDETDKVVKLYPPKNIAHEVRMGRSNVLLDPIEVRVIKYTIKEYTYVLLVTLLSKEKYPLEIFPDVYHSRWGIEEMYKVSKEITGVKDIHSKTEIGVKQELNAHYIIITMLKIIEGQAHSRIIEEKKERKPPKRRLRPLHDDTPEPENNKTNSRSGCSKTRIDDVATGPNQGLDQNPGHPETERSLTPYSEAEPAPQEGGNGPGFDQVPNQNDSEMEDKIKVNQKGCFLLVGWSLEKFLFWDPMKFVEGCVEYMIDSAATLYQKVRPNRSFERKSKTPQSKWTRGCTSG